MHIAILGKRKGPANTSERISQIPALDVRSQRKRLKWLTLAVPAYGKMVFFFFQAELTFKKTIFKLRCTHIINRTVNDLE